MMFNVKKLTHKRSIIGLMFIICIITTSCCLHSNGCPEWVPPTYTQQEKYQLEQDRLNWEIRKDLEHTRRVRSCYYWDNCKNDYEVYNRSYLEETYGRKK